GELAGPVETEFAYHVIKLEAIRGGTAQPFEQVRPMIETELKRQRASKRYAELAEQLNNIAYEQSDSLAPAAEALKVQVLQSPWISLRLVPNSLLVSVRFDNAALSDVRVMSECNGEVDEQAPVTLLATRLLVHKPASSHPFETVRDDIRTRLVEEEARKLALAEARRTLE